MIEPFLCFPRGLQRQNHHHHQCQPPTINFETHRNKGKALPGYSFPSISIYLSSHLSYISRWCTLLPSQRLPPRGTELREDKGRGQFLQGRRRRTPQPHTHTLARSERKEAAVRSKTRRKITTTKQVERRKN